MHPAILSIGTAVPPHIILQEEVPEFLIRLLKLNDKQTQRIRLIYRHTAIYKRHSVITDYGKERSEWDFLGSNYPDSVPGTTMRNEIYRQKAHLLACEAAKKAIENWGGDPASITHVISVSCTGMVAPGIEFDLIRLLKLKNTINRLGINFMGCFGAFKGLDVARAFAKEDRKNRILVVCTELCSLHFQADLDSETIVGNALFADGAAAVIVGTHPQDNETPLREMIQARSLGLDNSLDKMSWVASDHGYLMRLSPTVPVWIGRSIRSFIETLLPQELVNHDCDWAIHPGGKSIIQAIEKALQLEPHQTQAAWNILANYGNMSSATFLFVLEQLFQQAHQKPWAVGLAFGPGLSMEGLLLRTPK